MNTILALDPGIKTGWAIKSSALVCHGTSDFTKFKARDGAVYDAFLKWLDKLVYKTKPSVIVFESPIFRGKRSAFLFGFSCLINLTAERHKLCIYDVNIKSVKKHITGNGNAPKQQMESAIQLMGFKPKDDHQADAIGCLKYYLDNETHKEKF